MIVQGNLEQNLKGMRNTSFGLFTAVTRVDIDARSTLTSESVGSCVCVCVCVCVIDPSFERVALCWEALRY